MAAMLAYHKQLDKKNDHEEPKLKRRLGKASNVITWRVGWAGGGGVAGLQLVCGRPILALSSALVPQKCSCLVCVEDS